MTLRKAIFWTHLMCGVVSGVIVAIMSATGVAIAFEEELLGWKDREVAHIKPTADADARRLTLDELRAASLRQRPEFAVDHATIFRDPDHAVVLHAGREGPLYANPFTGEVRDSRAHGLHDVLHELEGWHRWLGMEGDWFPVGRAITGACNVAFVGLCVTGLWLWWPRSWHVRALKPRLWLMRGWRGKARDRNWHDALGFWSLPVLLVLGLTGVVISYEWGHRLVFTLAGEQAPESRNFGMFALPPLTVPEPSPGAEPVSLEQALAVIAARFPEWRSIGLGYPEAGGDGEALRPLHFDVVLPDYMPNRAWVPVESDPFTGEILRAVHYHDRSPGLRARVWMRFLHTGGGFGLTGKVIVTVASLAALVLVYTGFALSWRRLLRSGRSRPA
ncbi:MAG: PepSY-associated TM helix domain-containing protein [Verrucomicrobiota bacterium]